VCRPHTAADLFTAPQAIFWGSYPLKAQKFEFLNRKCLEGGLTLILFSRVTDIEPFSQVT
jgi:hypothetical protein